MSALLEVRDVTMRFGGLVAVGRKQRPSYSFGTGAPAKVSAVGAIGSSPVPAGAPMPALVVAPEAPAPVVEPPPPRR